MRKGKEEGSLFNMFKFSLSFTSSFFHSFSPCSFNNEEYFRLTVGRKLFTQDVHGLSIFSSSLSFLHLSIAFSNYGSITWNRFFAVQYSVLCMLNSLELKTRTTHIPIDTFILKTKPIETVSLPFSSFLSLSPFTFLFPHWNLQELFQKQKGF